MNRTTLSLKMVCGLILPVALASASIVCAEPPSSVHQRLKDPSPAVRKQAALTLAADNDAEAIPVLIDLLAELSADERRPIEELLTKLAGEWTPLSQFGSEDKIGRRIRRDAWMAWWRDTDGEALLGILEKHTLTPERRQKVKALIAKLRDDEFSIRQDAEAELHRLGRLALPQLREAMASKDRDTAGSAHRLVERIESDSSPKLPSAAMRLLALRKPEGATSALLTYLPLAEEENIEEEVKKALAALALRDGKPDKDLVRALKATAPAMRAAAAEALVKGGGKEGRQAVRALLADDAAAVRLRVALALAVAGDKDGVPVMIDLLTVLPDEEVGRVEEALCQLAGDSAPETSLGTEPGEKKKCRDAWTAWWKINAVRVDMARLTEQTSLGYTLICDIGGGRVYEIDRRGKQRWSIDNLTRPIDAVVVPGRRVLIAEYSDAVSERDFKGKILWQKQNLLAVCVQRLPNGNTFMAGRNKLLEVDRTGKEVYSINNMRQMINAAYRSRKGSIVCLTRANQCVFMDTTGKQLSSFPSNHGGNVGSLDVLPNGRILVTRSRQNKVVEFDSTGKTLREADAPGATTATGLPNGHLLIANQGEQRVYELDRAGKVVWEHKNAGQVFRARRR